LGGVGVDGKIILKWKLGVNWINVAQDRDHWQALVNTLMNLVSSVNGDECFDDFSFC